MKKQGQHVLTALQSDEEEKIVRQFIEKKGITFPVYLRKGDVPNVFKTPGIPATFIIDRDGAVVFK